MYIEECGYHALDNVFAVKGSMATRATDLLLLSFNTDLEAWLFFFVVTNHSIFA